jgi:hypothetical protein
VPPTEIAGRVHAGLTIAGVTPDDVLVDARLRRLIDAGRSLVSAPERDA